MTISASATPNGKIVLTGTVTATEPVTIALDSCDPTPCPFGVNNGKLQVKVSIHSFVLLARA